MIIIKEVTTRKDERIFIDFPIQLYKDVAAYVPPVALDEMNVFNPKKNLVHTYLTAIRFLAYKDNKVVGRIAGLVNHRINYESNKKQVRFTRIDMIDDINVTKALINAVESWAKEMFGMKEIIGPIGFTDFDREGMLIEGFEHINLVFTIYNFPYYKEHLEQLGFLKDVDWLEKRITWPSKLSPKIKRGAEIVRKRYGYRLYKPKTKADINSFIYDAFAVVNKAYKDLYGYLSIPNNVVDYYVKQMIPLADLNYVWVVYDKDDQIAGFGFTIPSLSLANKKNKGKLFPFGWIRMLGALKKYTTLDFYLIAVAPEHQNKGVTALIMEDAIETGIKKGVKFAETGPELELNLAIHSQWNSFEFIEHKRRRCFIKDIT